MGSFSKKMNNIREQTLENLSTYFVRQCQLVDALEKHIEEKNDQLNALLYRLNEQDNDTVIFNQSKPQYLYVIHDCTNDRFIFNARGGAFRNITDAQNKIERLLKQKGFGIYKIIRYSYDSKWCKE